MVAACRLSGNGKEKESQIEKQKNVMIKAFLLISTIGILMLVGLGIYLYYRRITLGERIFMVLMDIEQVGEEEFELTGKALSDYLVYKFKLTDQQARICIANRHNRDFFDEQPWLNISENDRNQI